MGVTWRTRRDEAGDTHYITIKGVGGLPIFVMRECIRYLLSLVAREVRAGELIVHSYAFVGNHAHFLVGSPHGHIHVPLKRILERFARYYNRTRDRVGHVFKDRFHSSRVASDTHFYCCVCYTDLNPVKAGLAAVATDYEFGSAGHYLRDRAPPWLTRRRVASYVWRPDPAKDAITESNYLTTFCKVDEAFIEELIERRSRAREDLDDPLDLFLSPDRPARIAWIRQQAELADGTTGPRLLAKASVLGDIIEERSGRRDWGGRGSGESEPPWRTLLVGLLRFGCARSYIQIQAILGISPSTIKRESRRHLEALREEPGYLLLAEELLSEAVRRSFRFLPPFTPLGPDGRARDRTAK